MIQCPSHELCWWPSSCIYDLVYRVNEVKGHPWPKFSQILVQGLPLSNMRVILHLFHDFVIFRKTTVTWWPSLQGQRGRTSPMIELDLDFSLKNPCYQYERDTTFLWWVIAMTRLLTPWPTLQGQKGRRSKIKKRVLEIYLKKLYIRGESDRVSQFRVMSPDRRTDGRTDGRTDAQGPFLYPPPELCSAGDKKQGKQNNGNIDVRIFQ